MLLSSRTTEVISGSCRSPHLRKAPIYFTGCISRPFPFLQSKTCWLYLAFYRGASAPSRVLARLQHFPFVGMAEEDTAARVAAIRRRPVLHTPLPRLPAASSILILVPLVSSSSSRRRHHVLVTRHALANPARCETCDVWYSGCIS